MTAKDRKRWWLFQRRYGKDAPFGLAVRYPEWFTVRRYSNLERARRGMDIERGDIHIAGCRYEWRIIDEETGEEVTE